MKLETGIIPTLIDSSADQAVTLIDYATKNTVVTVGLGVVGFIAGSNMAMDGASRLDSPLTSKTQKIYAGAQTLCGLGLVGYSIYKIANA